MPLRWVLSGQNRIPVPQMSVRTKLVDGRPTRPTLGLTINRDVEYLQVALLTNLLLPASVNSALIMLRLVRLSTCRGDACVLRGWEWRQTLRLSSQHKA